MVLLEESIKNKTVKIGVVGLGYVGLPVASVLLALTAAVHVSRPSATAEDSKF